MKREEYEKMFRAEKRFWWFAGKGRLVEEWVRAYFPSRGNFLDIGSGTGANLDRMENIPSWFGVDLSPEAIGFCTERGHRRLALAEVERLPFPDHCFEGALALDLFEHLPQDQSAANEIFRVLRPGGRLIVTVPAHPWLWGAHDLAMGHYRRYNNKLLRQLLLTAGFTILRLTHFLGFLFPAMLVGKLWQKGCGNPQETMSYEWPEAMNRLLLGVVEVELKCLRRLNLPAGTTLVALAEKPVR